MATLNPAETSQRYCLDFARELKGPWALHICAMFDDGSNVLRNIQIGAHSPQCSYDYFVLCLSRAMNTDILQSGATLRHEDGWTVDIPDGYQSPLAQIAAMLDDSPASGVQSPDASGAAAAPPSGPALSRRLAILSRGAVDTAWEVFTPRHVAKMKPMLFVPKAAGAEVAQRLRDAGVPVGVGPGDVEIVTPDAAPAQAGSQAASGPGDAHGGVGAAHQATGEWTPEAVLEYLRCNSPDGRPRRVSIETGPSVARRLYTRPPQPRPAAVPAPLSGACSDAVAAEGTDRDAGAAKDNALAWVLHGEGLTPSECPVDFLMLSAYSGPLDPRALGSPLVRKDVLQGLFEVVGKAWSEPSDDGTGLWTFTILRKRRA